MFKLSVFRYKNRVLAHKSDDRKVEVGVSVTQAAIR